jgi:hypothetical protein
MYENIPRNDAASHDTYGRTGPAGYREGMGGGRSWVWIAALVLLLILALMFFGIGGGDGTPTTIAPDAEAPAALPAGDPVAPVVAD